MPGRGSTHCSVRDIDGTRNMAHFIGLWRPRIDKKNLVSSSQGLVQIPGVDFVLELRFIVPYLIVHTYLLSNHGATRWNSINSNLSLPQRLPNQLSAIAVALNPSF